MATRVLTAGLSPVWQHVFELPDLRLGEVNRSKAVSRFASGKGVNVAIAVARMGIESLLVSTLGGPFATEAQEQLKRQGVVGTWIATSAATRQCVTLIDGSTRVVTEVVENAAPIDSFEVDRFVAAFHKASGDCNVAVLSGSLPLGAPVTLYRQLLSWFGGSKIIDAQGELLSLSLAARPTLVKPNREELGRTVGKVITNRATLVGAANSLRDQGAVWVAVTHGAEGVIAVGPEGAFQLVPPAIEVVNPIGSGDCFAGAVAAELSRGASMIEAIRHGVAAGTANAMTLLTADFTRGDVEELARRIDVKRVDS